MPRVIAYGERLRRHARGAGRASRWLMPFLRPHLRLLAARGRCWPPSRPALELVLPILTAA